MMNSLSIVLLLSGTSAYAADQQSKINDVKITFASYNSAQDFVGISGIVSGVSACQQSFSHIELQIAELDDGVKVVSAHLVKNPGVSQIVCVDKNPKDFAFNAHFSLSRDVFVNTYISTGQNELTSLSLQDMLNQADCAYPTTPALTGGFFGPGPVVPEICTFSVTEEIPNPFPGSNGLPLEPGPVIGSQISE